MKRSALKKQARAALKGHWGIAILVGLALIGANWVIGMIPMIGWIVSLAAVVLEFGFAAFYLSIVRGGDVEFVTLFTASFEGFFKKLGTYWLKVLYLFLWYLLFIIPGIVKSYAYSMADYVIYENPNLTADEAITISCKLTDGAKGELFVFDLSFIGWNLLNAFTFGILGIVYAHPYMYTAHAAIYDTLKLRAIDSGVLTWGDFGQMPPAADVCTETN